MCQTQHSTSYTAVHCSTSLRKLMVFLLHCMWRIWSLGAFKTGWVLEPTFLCWTAGVLTRYCIPICCHLVSTGFLFLYRKLTVKKKKNNRLKWRCRGFVPVSQRGPMCTHTTANKWWLIGMGAANIPGMLHFNIQVVKQHWLFICHYEVWIIIIMSHSSQGHKQRGESMFFLVICHMKTTRDVQNIKM